MIIDLVNNFHQRQQDQDKMNKISAYVDEIGNIIKALIAVALLVISDLIDTVIRVGCFCIRKG